MFNRFVLTATLILAGLIAVTTAQTTTALPKPSRSCQNDGMIVGRGRYPKCRCSPGFKGYDCSQRVTPCEIGPCRNGGTCSENRDGTFTCDCTALYKGILCEHRIRPCDSGPCKNGGNCTDDGIKCFQCECLSGFKGPDCSSKIEGLYSSEILNKKENYIVQLEKWLGGAKPWKLCYRATDHGWASSIFHFWCDFKNPTVTIIRSQSYIFGAYSDVAFGGSTSYRNSFKAFIFSFVNKDNLPPFKSPVYRHTANALYTKSTYGPTFGGGHDIHISNNADANNDSYTNLGNTYQPPNRHYSYTSTKMKNLLAGTFKFTPNEVETFYLN